MKRQLFVFICFISGISLLSCKSNVPKTEKALISDTSLLIAHVTTLVNVKGYRTYDDTAALSSVATYISNEFKKSSSRVSFQNYKVLGKEYRNVICSFGPEKGERLIIGAHYDVCGNQSGADDNASGIAGILELSRLLKNKPLEMPVDIVAYSLEEPPFFRSTYMGSYVHAKYLHDNHIPVMGMICLEMIGYFNDASKSQNYPIGFLRWIYGSKADYILVVQKLGSGNFGRRFNRKIQNNLTIKTRFLRSPKFLTGVDFSDHRNYWKFGYDALMVTNTSFYRNKNYHTIGDTIQTLDFNRMAKVVDEVYLTIINLNK